VSTPEREPLSSPTHLAEKILTSRSALEGERKQATAPAWQCTGRLFETTSTRIDDTGQLRTEQPAPQLALLNSTTVR
jgi:hypothetical protein